MTTHVLGPTVPSGRVVAVALGVDASNKLSDKDIGKPVKLIASDTYGLCGNGDEIEGILMGVENHTVNEGFSFGSILTGYLGDRAVAMNKNGSTLAIGTYVVAAAQEARGTVNSGSDGDGALPYVKAGVANDDVPVTFRTPNTFLWRVVSHLGGTGANNTPVLIERVG